MDEYMCERCHKKPAMAKQKYCKECKRIVNQELLDSGYFQQTGDLHVGQRRTKEMAENTYQTKHGTGH